MNRRQFLKAAAAPVVAASGGALCAQTGKPGSERPRVAIFRHRDSGSDDPQRRKQAVARLVHWSVQAVVGAPTPQEAWRKLFREGDRVAIKVNCLAPRLAPRPEVIEAIVVGLGVAGVAAEDVIVFDKENRDLIAAGFEVNHDGPGYRCYGTLGDDRTPGYEQRFRTINETTSRYSQIVTRECTALINVPVLKDHEYAGITAALKNHFGCIHNPEDFHMFKCDPAVADVNTHPDIRQKQRLIVADALNVLYDGGPSFKPDAVWPYYGIMAGIDPVAFDAEVAVLIDLIRRKNGLKTLAECGRPPVHIDTAARYELGINDLARIQLVQRGTA
ncbi:MAG: DUF362 domain-containing protein [Armatimonadota bacterium]